MTTNRIHPTDRVLVELFFDGKKISTYEGEGFHTVEQVVEAAYEKTNNTDKSPEDYVYRVTNLADNTTVRYRVNAGGNVKLIPEE